MQSFARQSFSIGGFAVLRIVLAYIAASLTAGLIITLVSAEWLFAPHLRDLEWGVAYPAAGLTLFFGAVILLVTAVPGAAAIHFARRRSIVSWYWFVAAGLGLGVIGALGHILIVGLPEILSATQTWRADDFMRFVAFEASTVPMAGAAAGFVFWLLAVRSSDLGAAP